MTGTIALILIVAYLAWRTFKWLTADPDRWPR